MLSKNIIKPVFESCRSSYISVENVDFSIKEDPFDLDIFDIKLNQLFSTI